MKLAYIVILSKPSSSKTWTPYPIKDRPAGNYFATPKSALEYSKNLAMKGMRTYLHGAKQVDLLQFSLGWVYLNDPPHIIKPTIET